jgi:hypothetical protein
LGVGGGGAEGLGLVYGPKEVGGVLFGAIVGGAFVVCEALSLEVAFAVGQPVEGVAALQGAVQGDAVVYIHKIIVDFVVQLVWVVLGFDADAYKESDEA